MADWSNKLGFAVGVLTGVALAASSVAILKKQPQTASYECHINSQQIEAMRAQATLERNRSRVRDISERVAQMKSSCARKQVKNTDQKLVDKERRKGPKTKGHETKCSHKFPRKNRHLATTRNLKSNHKRQQNLQPFKARMRGKDVSNSGFASPITHQNNSLRLTRVEEEIADVEISEAEENCYPT